MNDFLLIKNGIIVSQNEDYDIFSGDILIQDGRIKKIGKDIKVNKDYKIINATGKVIVPAFYNMHVHLGETVFRGRCDGMNLWEYLDVSHKSYDDVEWMDNEKEIHKLSGLITINECIENGIVYIACNRGWDEAIEMKIQASCAYPIVNVNKLKGYYDKLDQIKEMIQEYGNEDIEVSIFLQSLYLCDEEKLLYISKLLKTYPKIKLFVHVAETKEEIDYVYDNYEMTPIQVLFKYNLLCERTYCVHMIYVSKKDIELIKKSRANVVLCPISNLKLDDGFPNVNLYLDNDISLCVATDGFATNNSAGILEELKLIGLMLHGKIDCNVLLDMITKNPAQSLKEKHRSGMIKEGDYADISIFDTEIYNICDLSKIPNQLIYNNAGFRCTYVINRGNIIYQNGILRTVNISEYKEDYFNLMIKLFLKDR